MYPLVICQGRVSFCAACTYFLSIPSKAFMKTDFSFPEGVVMDSLWFELILFRELPLAEQRQLLIARREKLFEQQARIEQLQKELEEQQAWLEQLQGKVLAGP